MKQQSYKESDLKFYFDHQWMVKRYDEHAYFKALSGRGLKGVDFIGIFQKRYLYLIEVKNYQHRSYSPIAPDWEDLVGDIPPLSAAFMGKVKDSLQLIRVVKAVLNRKWWYKPLLFWNRLIGNKQLDKDWKFWTQVYELSKSSEQVYPVLWIELDPEFLKQEGLDEITYIDRLKKNTLSALEGEEQAVQMASINLNAEGVPGLLVQKLECE